MSRAALFSIGNPPFPRRATARERHGIEFVQAVTEATRLAVQDLSILAYANGFTLWHYKAPTSERAALTQSSFLADTNFADLIASGDLVIVSLASGPVMLAVRITDGAVKQFSLIETGGDAVRRIMG